MKILDTVGVIEELCKAKKCYGLYFDFKGGEGIYYAEHGPNFDGFCMELRKAIPFMFEKCKDKGDVVYAIKPEFMQAFVDSEGWIMFDHYYIDDQQAVMKFNYNQIVGDDGPTKLNDYDGPLRVYAITFGPDGSIKDNSQ